MSVNHFRAVLYNVITLFWTETSDISCFSDSLALTRPALRLTLFNLTFHSVLNALLQISGEVRKLTASLTPTRMLCCGDVIKFSSIYVQEITLRNSV